MKWGAAEAGVTEKGYGRKKKQEKAEKGQGKEAGRENSKRK